MSESVPIWMMVLGFLCVLGPLVTIHELGHYLVGRWFGVEAVAFSVGFGKEIAGYTDKRGTRWKLSLIPLGGYVQFKGDMDPASIPNAEELDKIPVEERKGSFHHASLGRRAAIVFAGPFTNLLVAILIFAGFFLAYGRPVETDNTEENIVAGFAEKSPAREAGIKIGDRIIEVNGIPMPSYPDLQRYIWVRPKESMIISVVRGEEKLKFPITTIAFPVEDKFGNKSTIGLIGIEGRPMARKFEDVGPITAISMGVDQSYQMMKLMGQGIKQIVIGQRSVDELGGPIKIAKYSGERLSLGPEAFAEFAAMISLNLAFINLLPIPALDGGHLAFYAVEAIRRKPIGPRATALAYQTGVALVLALMVFVTINDFVSLPIFG